MAQLIRLALVLDHPAQQFTKAFQLLAAEAGIQPRIYYWSVARQVDDPDFGRPISWDVDMLAGYPWSAPEAAKSATARLRWLLRRFRADRPAVVVCFGWTAPIARMAIIYCLLSRTRLLIYSDSTWQHFTNSRHSPFRWFLLRILMHLSTGALATGTFNREFYILHGMPPSRIWPGVCPADTGFFAQARADRSEEPAPDSLVRIGFAGKLIARKGVDELLEAVAALPSAADWSLVIVGEGPLKPRLQQLAARLKVADKVAFYGFANTTEMPKLLAGVDIVVVPSRRDMRVLLTIEAMAAGAALIVSDATAVWGPGDLIEHEVTGLVYPSGDPGALADQLRRLLEDRQLLATLRARGTERAESFGPAAFARTTAAAIRSCLARSAPGQNRH